MLNLFSQFGARDCGHTTRRDFLRIGALGLGGLALPSLLAQRAAGSAVNAIKDKSVVLLFLCGGASQIETFDPKMSAPSECRSSTGEVRTSLPGVTFGGTFPKMARLADKLAVVRSYSPHAEADHAKAIQTVFTVGSAAGGSIGAVTARLRGSSYLPSGMPAYASLIGEEVDSQYREDQERMIRSDSAGQLGPACAPFRPGAGGQIERDMKLDVPLERLNDRVGLLESLDRMSRRVDGAGVMDSLDEFNGRAVDML